MSANIYRDSAVAEGKSASKWLREALDTERSGGNGHVRDRKQSMGEHAMVMSALWTLCAEVNRSNELLEGILEHLKSQDSKMDGDK
jgi:hypothetical protein